MSTFKAFHLEEDTADLGERVGIGSSARRNPERCPQLLGATVDLRVRAAVEDLDDVDLAGDPLDRVFAQVAPACVVGVFQIDQPSLVLDGGDRLFCRQLARNRLLEKESDQLALSGQDLLPDDGCLARLQKRSGAVDAFVIREEDGGEAQLAAAASHTEGWNPTIKGSGAVQVQIDPDSGDARASRHVRYYRRGEGSGKGSRKVRTSEGWPLPGKERLSSRNKLAPWS